MGLGATTLRKGRSRSVVLDRPFFTCDKGQLTNQPCVCGRNHFADASTIMRRDPTQTHDLRKRFAQTLDRRWNALSSVITRALVVEDRWGIASLSPRFIGIIQQSGSQVKDFQDFVDAAMNHVILGDDRDMWVGAFITQAFERGWKRAEMQTSMDFPVAYDRASVVTALCVTELQGAMEAASQQAVRCFSSGLIAHDKPSKIASAVKDRLMKIGRTRSRATAAAQIVRAFSEATLDVFELARVPAVGLVPEHTRRPRVHDADLPSARTIRRITARERLLSRLNNVEVLTAGDDLVCQECEDISDDGPYTINQARGLIPAHPECRCAFVPADDERFADDALPPIIAEYAIDPEPPVAYLGVDGMQLAAGMQLMINRDATMAHTLGQAHAEVPDCVLEVDLTRVPRYADITGVHTPAGLVLYLNAFDPALDVWIVTAHNRSFDTLDEWNEEDHPRDPNGEFANGGGPAKSARDLYKETKGTDKQVNERLVQESGVKVVYPTDPKLHDDANEAAAHLVGDKFLEKDLKGTTIHFKDLPGKHGVSKGNDIYVSEKSLRDHGPGFGASVARHELQHTKLSREGVPSSQQEERVRHVAGTWAAQKSDSMWKTNNRAAKGFELAAKEQGIKRR
jgi:hypothetical protein